jgi:DNA-binding transcriptional ArsR family regulator
VTTLTADPLSATFAALADPTRRAILARLADGESSVTEIASPFEMSLPAVSKHLKVLERAGLIERGREAQWRPCRLQAAPLKQVDEWVEAYRRHWEERFDRLDEYLRELQAKAEKSADEEAGGRSPAP